MAFGPELLPRRHKHASEGEAPAITLPGPLYAIGQPLEEPQMDILSDLPLFLPNALDTLPALTAPA